MRVLITGVDGYLGWSLAQYLAARGHEVGGIDNFFRRSWVEEMGSHSIIPIASMKDRLSAFQQQYGKMIQFREVDLREYLQVVNFLSKFKPETIVHFGECPSAPYSMIDVFHANFVQNNNITSTFNILFAIRDTVPQAHLIKLGTMGEYGTPNVDIPEGFFEVQFRGRHDRLPFPRQAASWYHWSKVHTSNNVMFASRIWKLRATDIMQGVVYGTRIDEMNDNRNLFTRFDIDQAFGTVINRFCAQAVIGHALSIYGSGGQKRGIIPLRDSMRCIALALENPPDFGEYRVFNQFEDLVDVYDIALKVQRISRKLGLNAEIANFENPRQEQESHYYNPDRRQLLSLGYDPTLTDIESEIEIILSDLIFYSDRISSKRELLIPDVWWNGLRNKTREIKSKECESKF